MIRCLLVEDDTVNAKFVQKALEKQGYHVTWAADGATALEQLLHHDWSLVILDRMLPDEFDGLSLLTTIRSLHKSYPVLVLSALSGLDDRVRGLKAGGDDYLVKPFALPELLARVEVLLRRYVLTQKPEDSTELIVGDLRIDLLSAKVERAGQTLLLQPKELQLLVYLIKHKNQIVTRSMLLEQVWGYRFEPNTNLTDVQISRLRNKIDKPFEHAFIQTVRGVGYRFVYEA